MSINSINIKIFFEKKWFKAFCKQLLYTSQTRKEEINVISIIKALGQEDNRIITPFILFFFYLFSSAALFSNSISFSIHLCLTPPLPFEPS